MTDKRWGEGKHHAREERPELAVTPPPRHEVHGGPRGGEREAQHEIQGRNWPKERTDWTRDEAKEGH